LTSAEESSGVTERIGTNAVISIADYIAHTRATSSLNPSRQTRFCTE
jgi:hypothetical protein